MDGWMDDEGEEFWSGCLIGYLVFLESIQTLSTFLLLCILLMLTSWMRSLLREV